MLLWFIYNISVCLQGAQVTILCGAHALIKQKVCPDKAVMCVKF